MKRIINDPFVWLCIAILLFFGVHYTGQIWQKSPTETLTEAQMSYIKAERTKNISERRESFNQSLKLFLELEKKYDPIFGNGKFYFDIGNNFFQLEEYPQALLYYYRAHLLRPADQKVMMHIDLAKKKLGLPSSIRPTAFGWLFFFHNDYSLPERLQFLAILNILAFALLSLCIWFDYRIFCGGAVFFGILGLVFFLSVSYTHLFSSLEGVIIKSTLLYRDAGSYYAKVTPEPLKAGHKVKLLKETLGGKWIKIETEEGTIGYLPQETIRPI